MNQSVTMTSGLRLLKDAFEACNRGDMQLAERVMFSVLLDAEQERRLPDQLVEAVHELATIYCVKRKYDDAARLYKRVLSAREKILGPNHPDLVDSLDRLAIVLRESNAKSDASAVQFRAMSIRRRLVNV